MAEAARGQTLTRLLEGTGLAIGSLRLGRDQSRSPARNEIRVVGADQIVRVHRHADEPVAAPPAAVAPQPTETSAPHDTDSNTIPTLRNFVSADENWQDAGFFNVRVQRRADGAQTRVVVRQIDRTGATESAEAARWMGPSVDAAAQWMESRTSALAVVRPPAVARHLPCTLTIAQAYAYQDIEEIDPRPLDAARMNAGVPLAADTPLTLAIAINASDSQPASEDRPVKRCRVAVYVKTFPTGEQAEIGAHVLEINPAMDSWVARVPIKGLAAGKYRMTIVATLEAPYGGIAHREIPLVRVSQGAT